MHTLIKWSTYLWNIIATRKKLTKINKIYTHKKNVFNISSNIFKDNSFCLCYFPKYNMAQACKQLHSLCYGCPFHMFHYVEAPKTPHPHPFPRGQTVYIWLLVRSAYMAYCTPLFHGRAVSVGTLSSNADNAVLCAINSSVASSSCCTCHPEF